MDVYVEERSYPLCFYVYDKDRWITENILDTLTIPYRVYLGYNDDTVRYNTRWSLPWAYVKMTLPWCILPANKYPLCVNNISILNIAELEPLEADVESMDQDFIDSLNDVYNDL